MATAGSDHGAVELLLPEQHVRQLVEDLRRDGEILRASEARQELDRPQVLVAGGAVVRVDEDVRIDERCHDQAPRS